MQYVWSASGLNSISIFDVYIKERRGFFLQSESDWYLIDWLIAIWGRVCGQSVYIYKERGDIRKGWWGKCWRYFLLQSSASCHMSTGVHLEKSSICLPQMSDVLRQMSAGKHIVKFHIFNLPSSDVFDCLLDLMQNCHITCPPSVKPTFQNKKLKNIDHSA